MVLLWELIIQCLLVCTYIHVGRFFFVFLFPNVWECALCMCYQLAYTSVVIYIACTKRCELIIIATVYVHYYSRGCIVIVIVLIQETEMNNFCVPDVIVI